MNPDNPMPKTTHEDPNLPSARPAGSADEAWRHYQYLYRRDVPVPEIEAAYRQWRELAEAESQQPNKEVSHGHPTTQKDTI
jgi:hypothetical protein